jgi:hypothetical protein
MRRFSAFLLFVNVAAATFGLTVAANELSPPDPVAMEAISAAAPEQPANVSRPAHWAITAPNYDVCAWTGVRDGVLGYGGANVLTEYYSFWYIDHYWTFCSARLTWAGDFHCWIVSRHDGYTLHLGAC